MLSYQLGIVDSLTLFQFCLNCGAQYTGLTLADAAADLDPSVLLAPIHGLGTSYQYVRPAQGAMERRSRIATVAAFMSMSVRPTLTDPATNARAGGTIATFIGHMKSVIEKSKNSTGNLVFVNPAMLSKLTNDEFIVLNVAIVGGVLLIIIISYILPRIGKAYCNSSKKLVQYTIRFVEKKIDNLRQIKH